MGVYLKGEEVLIFKNKDYSDNEYPGCLVGETFRVGKVIHYDDSEERYWVRGEDKKDYIGHYYYGRYDHKGDNAVIMSRSDFLRLLRPKIEELSNNITNTMDGILCLLEWFNSNCYPIMRINGNISVFDEKNDKYRDVNNFGKYLEVGEKICSFNCSDENESDNLDCVIKAMLNHGFVSATITSRTDDDKIPTYTATYGKDNEYTLNGFYAEVRPGSPVFLRPRDLLILIRAKSKELEDINRKDNIELARLQKLYHEVSGSIIGNSGYVPQTVVEQVNKK